MRLLVVVGLVAMVCGCVERPVPAVIDAAAPPAAKVYIVRHFEKAEGEDPSLSPAGAANAERLAGLLKNSGIVAIFATPTRRAMETAAPLAGRLGIAVTPYDPSDPAALAAAVAALSGPALVVGHSNTVPDFIDRLGGPPQPPMSEEDFGTVFVVLPDGTVKSFAVR